VCVTVLIMVTGFVAGATGARAAAGDFRLNAGEELVAGQSLVSLDGLQTLSMQTDGNLVLYGDAGSRWQTATNGRGGVRLALQTDGNLVLYDANNYPLWYTDTRGSGADHLDVQSDGNLVLYTASSGVVWQTNTRYQPASLSAPADLRAGEVLVSPSGQYTLAMQTDGNLVLYGPSGWTWQTNTRGSGAVRLAIQTDGNLVLYTSSDYPAWIAGTRGSGLNQLKLQDDGNLVGYRPDGSWAWQTYTYPGGSAPAPTPPPPPAASKAEIAIAYARQQIGKPYLWGGIGPNAFDCSGLTQQSWAAAGVRIARVSRDQYNTLRHVPYSQAAPGDIIAYATNTASPTTIYHVALYIGNGQMIEAPAEGKPVRLTSVRTANRMPSVGRPTG